jgi:hypothetical protein
MNDDDGDDHNGNTEDIAMRDTDGIWHVVADRKTNHIATCGTKIKVGRHKHTKWQRNVGAGERCVRCKWSTPPQFMKLMTRSEREYLDCVAEVDAGKNGKLRSDHFDNRIETASHEWGWGVDSLTRRRALARQLIRVADEIGDGSDELIEAKGRLLEARKIRRQAQEREQNAIDEVERIECQLLIDINRNAKSKSDKE